MLPRILYYISGKGGTQERFVGDLEWQRKQQPFYDLGTLLLTGSSLWLKSVAEPVLSLPSSRYSLS